jgi:hypothetical protein
MDQRNRNKVTFNCDDENDRNAVEKVRTGKVNEFQILKCPLWVISGQTSRPNLTLSAVVQKRTLKARHLAQEQSPGNALTCHFFPLTLGDPRA